MTARTCDTLYGRSSNENATFSVCGEAGNGPEALKKAESTETRLRFTGPFDPGMNGIETAKVLRRLLPKHE